MWTIFFHLKIEIWDHLRFSVGGHPEVKCSPEGANESVSMMDGEQVNRDSSVENSQALGVEASLMAQLQHPFLVGLRESFTHENRQVRNPHRRVETVYEYSRRLRLDYGK